MGSDPNKRVQELLGSRIRTRRETLGLSQEAMAAECGLHRTYYGSVERGERNVALRNIIKIADALGISPASLIDGLTFID